MTVLLREAVGERLRRARADQSRTLRDVSRAARVSLGYLSEVERGRKEASSELLGSICDALDLPLPELLVTVAGDLDTSDSVLGASVVDTPAEIDGGRLVPSLVGAESEGEEFAESEDSADRRLHPMLSQRISAPVRSSNGRFVAA